MMKGSLSSFRAEFTAFALFYYPLKTLPISDALKQPKQYF